MFRTYKDVELYPGPRLNVIIGPNGSGYGGVSRCSDVRERDF